MFQRGRFGVLQAGHTQETWWWAFFHFGVHQNVQPMCFWPFGIRLGTFGPFPTNIDFLLRSTSAKPYFVHSVQKIHFCLKWSKGVRSGPKRVSNGQKHLCWPSWSLLDPNGPLWNVDKPAMFGYFWSKMDQSWKVDPEVKEKKLMPGYHKNIGRGGESVFWLSDHLFNDGDAVFQKTAQIFCMFITRTYMVSNKLLWE